MVDHVYGAAWTAATKNAGRAAPPRTPSFVFGVFLALIGMVAGLVVAFAGFPLDGLMVVVQAGGPDPTAIWKDGLYQPLQNPRVYVWAAFLGAEVGIWAVIGIPLWQSMLRARTLPRFWRRRSALSTVVLIFFLFFVPGLVSRLFWPHAAHVADLPGHDLRTFLLAAAGFLVALPAVLGIWVVSQEAAQTAAKLPTPADALPVIRAYLRRRGDLQDHLSLLGLLTAVSTVGVAALRGAVNTGAAALISDKGVPAPDDVRLVSSDAVLLYGLYFSMLLALVYIPTYAQLTALGRSLCDLVAGLPDPNDANFMDLYGKRKTMEELTDVRTGPLDNLRTSLAILAPFVGGIIGTALPGT